jgi:hypothetical protein
VEVSRCMGDDCGRKQCGCIWGRGKGVEPVDY